MYSNVFVTSFIVTHVLYPIKFYMNVKGLKFKVLLIIDNAPEHPIIEHLNMQFCFLPSNTTSPLQPLDQSIIATFKKHTM